MHGIVFEIRRFTVHDGPGIRTTVFMKGCPLSCWWCHNPEGLNPKPEPWARHEKLNGQNYERHVTIGQKYSPLELMDEIRKDRIFFDESGGGVTFSGGEPLLQHEFLAEILALCRKEGIHAAIDTSGYVPVEILGKIAPVCDLFLYDLKLFDETLHRKYTGVSNRNILRNLFFLAESGAKVILRRPVIPSINDMPQETLALKKLLSKLGSSISVLHLLPYHSIARNKYRKAGIANRLEHLKDLTADEVEPLAEELRETGIQVIIGG